MLNISARTTIALTTILTLFMRPGLTSAEADRTYSSVRVVVESPEGLRILQEHGIDAEHYSGSFRSGIELVLDDQEIERLRQTGLTFEILIQDLGAAIARRAPLSREELDLSRQIQQGDNVEGFEFGSMGGFYTFNQVVTELDSMFLLYPNLITQKTAIGTTVQGRSIWMVKISDNPGVDESATEKAVYYDALHHAREPASMMTTLYYMYWLLQNYGTDPQATYLVNNRELFFVPVVNPDGYVYNESTNPNGGGFWRKNRRVNGGGCLGVDINRNYSFGYGNNNGSSSDPCSETYRGPSAFSEPESQAVRDLIAEINPVIAFSTHTYADRYLNPYGYNDQSPDFEVYSDLASVFLSGSTLLYGATPQMLGYYASGTTKDYLHSEGTYAWSPELGSEGFWPPQSSIFPIATQNLSRFRAIAWAAGGFADLQSLTPLGSIISGDTLDLTAAVKNRGLGQSALNVTATVTTTYPHAVTVVGSANYGSIPPRTIASNTGNPFRFFITGSASYLDDVAFVVTIQQEGVETARDTITLTVGSQTVLFSDDAENGKGLWTTSGNGIPWDTTFVDFSEGLHSFTDSRYGNSNDNTSNYLTLVAPIDLSTSTHPQLEFDAKWSIEQDFDYARVQISTNGGTNWISLVGQYTQTFGGQPSYMGTQHWIREQINLLPYAAGSIRLRFHYDTDGGIPGDGFYFDNVRVVDYTDEGIPAIPCEDITTFLVRCNASGVVQSKILLQNSTAHAGKLFEWLIDGESYTQVIQTNGINSIARLSVQGLGAGEHTVELVDPPGCFDPVEVVCQVSAVADAQWEAIERTYAAGQSEHPNPVQTALRGSYPNPFNPSTTIRFTLGEDGPVSLRVYDMLGQEVATLVDGFAESGDHSVVWNGVNNLGQPVASGLYFYRLSAASMVMTQKMMLAK